MNVREQLKLYFVMGSNNCTTDPAYVLEQAILGGVTTFQFREKGFGSLVGDEKLELAKKLQFICKNYKIPFIVNDDIELALLLEADGVHIGQEDGEVQEIREKIGQMLLGVSCHNIDEARVAITQGADYIGVGPMFPTITKLDTREVTGPVMISNMRESGIHIPIVGIGGINEGNAKSVFQSGADGIAVISAISLAESPKEAAEILLNRR